jgi:hypothetical protein
MGPTPQNYSTKYTPQSEWCTRSSCVYELASSLLIEQDYFEKHAEIPREPSIENDKLVPPKKYSATFRFEVLRVIGIDLRRFDTVNRMFAVAPHFGLAFVRFLIVREIVPASYASELANRKRTRISVHDANFVVFPITINAPDAESVATAAETIEEFLMFDYIRIAALAEKCEFQEFASIEVVRRV